MLKHVLDTNLKEYIHKAAGVVGVSAGVFGGARAIQNLMPVLRELGLVTIFWDVNFTTVRRRFDESGNLVDDSFLAIDKFLDELLWMAETLRYGRENVTIGGTELTRPTMTCPKCGTPMNHQAESSSSPSAQEGRASMPTGLDGVLELVFACPGCGWIDSRRESASRHLGVGRGMHVLDPRLLHRARAARVLLVVDAALGVVMALLVLAQAVLLARVAARSFEGASLDEVATPLVLLVGGRGSSGARAHGGSRSRAGARPAT